MSDGVIGRDSNAPAPGRSAGDNSVAPVPGRSADVEPVAPGATVFADPRYLEAMAPVSGGRFERVSTDRDDAFLNGMTRKRGFISEVALPLFSPFSGLAFPVLNASDVHAKSDPLALLGAALESRYDRVRLHVPPSHPDLRPLQWRGWQVAPLYTYCLRLTSPDSAEAGWTGFPSSSARRLVRKHDSDYRVQVSSDGIPDAVTLMLGSYARQGRAAPCDRAALVQACLALASSGLAECMVARTSDDEAAAGIVLLHGPRASYYWIAGSHPGPAMTVLLHHACAHLAGMGVTTLDLVGANTPSIAEFKRRLGAELVGYASATYQSGIAMRLIQGARGLMGR